MQKRLCKNTHTYMHTYIISPKTSIFTLVHTSPNDSHTRTCTPNLQSSSVHAPAFLNLSLSHTRTHASTRTIIGLSVACQEQPRLPDLRLLISRAEVAASADISIGTRHRRARLGMSGARGSVCRVFFLRYILLCVCRQMN